MTEQVLVGRQPIYNSSLDVVAYELLFRGSNWATRAAFDDGDSATAQVILNTFLEIGLNNIVGQLPAFINLTRGFVLGDHTLPVEKDRIVLEVLEDIEVDDRLIHGLRSLSEEGYTIALDDFTYSHKYTELVEVADIIKVDVLSQDRDTLKEHVDVLRQFSLKLLAEKIETQEDFEFCRSLGFDYYQGFFLSKPRIISGKRIATDRLVTLQLLAILYAPETDDKQLVEAIASNGSLSQRLLRYINSNIFSLAVRVDSLSRLLALTGVRHIQNCISLTALSGISGLPNDLITTAAIRAKMCELLAEAAAKANRECYFTAGLFSNLDAVLGMPIEEILKSLPLDKEVARAVQKTEGELGAALRCVIQYERGQWDGVAFESLDIAKIKDCYLESIAWARKAVQALMH
ncbi:MAG: EAL domain-containing protein [Gammaproteobacteria bacterium]|nr:EAL domain-containing protein [Gammaproteobacteria bacterium]MCI0590028.1 EAL domain-containing protein [Gammaproteobacteria bacterium]